MTASTRTQKVGAQNNCGSMPPNGRMPVRKMPMRRASALAATLCTAVAMEPGAAAAASEPATAGAPPSELEEIIVTGIRASLEQSIEIKRDADLIVDSIASEDLGKFPDANLAESLQRITGVAISRNDRGEGSEITVRGFGPQFNVVLVNGRKLPSFILETLAAELIAGADVYKSSAPALQDGGIGAVVNLRTPRPLEMEGSQLVLSAKGTYEDLAGNTAPAAFALFSDKFANERWGAMLSVSYQERDSRTESAGVQSYLPHMDLDPVGITDVFFPRQMTQEVSTSQLKRTGVTGTVQLQATDQLRLTLDGLWDRYEPNTQTYQLSHYFTPDNIDAATIGPNRTVTSLTTNEFGHTDFTRSYNRMPVTIEAGGFNAAWGSAESALSLELDVSTSIARADERDKTPFTVVGYQNIVNWSYSGSGLPRISTAGIPSLGIPANAFTDTSINRAHYVAYGGGVNSKDRTDELRLDGVWSIDQGVLSRVKFGSYYSSRTDRNNVYTSDPCSYCGYSLLLPSSLLSVYDAGSDFLGGGVFPTAWLTFDPDAYVAHLRSVSGDPGLYASTLSSSSTRVEEDAAAGYLQLDLAGDVGPLPWRVNLGVRYVHTKLTSAGSSTQLVDLLNVPGDPTIYDPVYADDGASLPVSAENSYNNWLPSLNARLNLTDDIIVRFAASRTLTRPSLGDLAPRLSYEILRPNNLIASSGNPELKPYLSTNFDAALEWYYNRGGYLTLAYFRKKVDDYVVNSFGDETFPIGNASGDFPDGTAAFRVIRPRNVETAEVAGVELAFQHTFDYLPAPFDGLGFTANATFVDSPSTLSPGDGDTTRSFALEGVGDSQNLMVFYEKGPIGVRASYNHRDDYLAAAFSGEGNEPLFVKGYGVLDVQVSYRFGEHLMLTLEGSNLTDVSRQTHGRYANQWIERLDSGARYALGVRATF